MVKKQRTKNKAKLRANFNESLLTAPDDAYDFRLWFSTYEGSICMYSAFLMAYNYNKYEICRELYDMLKHRRMDIDYLMHSIAILSRGRMSFADLPWWRYEERKQMIIWSDAERVPFTPTTKERFTKLVMEHNKGGIISYEFRDKKICTIHNGDTCLICYTDFTEDMVRNDEVRICTACVDGDVDTSLHAFCVNCFTQNVRIKKKDNAKIYCMGHECTAIYHNSDIRQVVDSDSSDSSSQSIRALQDSHSLNLPDLSSSERKELAININDMVDEGMICPLCQEFCIVIGSQHSDLVKKRYCHACDRELCLDCMQEVHPGRSCEQIQKYDKDVIRRAIERAFSNGLLHECPICHVRYTKISGCNKMTCPQCGEHSCYLCGQHIVEGGPDRSIYWHFRQNGSKCSTFNRDRHGDTEHGNLYYDRTRVLTICKQILCENTHDQRIHDELARQIIILSSGTDHVITYADLGVNPPKNDHRSQDNKTTKSDYSTQDEEDEGDNEGHKRCVIC